MSGWTRWIGALSACGLLAAACGDERDEPETATTTIAATDDDAGTTDGGGGIGTTAAPPDGDEGTGTTAAPEAEMFGDLAWPCGPGDRSGYGASDVGVTEETIVIGTGDDRGFPSSPGLNKSIGDAIEALVARCNELGGINGRAIELRLYDAAILAVNEAMTQACEDDNFMLVGQGFALDASQEEIRLGCGLPSVPTYSVSAAFAHAPLMIQPVPNPADEYNSGLAAMLADLFPEEIRSAAILGANFSANIETGDKVEIAYPEEGWVIQDRLEYNVSGEDDWTPFALQLKNAGTRAMYYSGSCLPSYQAFMQSAAVNGLDLVVAVEANGYEAGCAAANTDGAMDGTFLKMVFIPFEEADVNPATADYVDLVTDAGGEISLLGMQATSAFFLWASAARDCGADLTRSCVLDTIATYADWTAGGLHAPSDPAGNHPVECAMLLEMRGTEYVRVHPDEPGTFSCEDGSTLATPTVWAEQAALDENRVSTLFAATG